jgi:methionyl aminopeptidase
MTIGSEDELEKLKKVGRVVAGTLKAMTEAMEPGMTTRELDAFGRILLEREGARPAPESTYISPVRPASPSRRPLRTAFRATRCCAPAIW